MAMDFSSSNKPIYLQIYDAICERIISGELPADERILSVRDYGAKIGVNPNTVMRTFEKLTSDGIIYNKRGLGYFVSPNAKEIVLENERKEFLENELPKILHKMKLLGINSEILTIK
ncbi:MAG: GntR family transcriptional regulator [Candidatus Cryptobacteroides sp.]